MPVVLVHGVPETTALWDRLVPLLDGPAITLALPGFGNRRPDGFNSTMDEYFGWLERELEAVDGPIDLVGHDWGGILTYRLVSTKPGRVRSWASDAVGAGNPGFVWHDTAKLWQTPGEGEKFMENMQANPAGAGQVYESLGIPEPHATLFANALDEEMSDSILKLYRSATDIPGDWGPGIKPTDPGLVIGGDSDPFISARRSTKAAAELGVEAVILEGGGH